MPNEEHSLFIVWKPEYNLGISIIDEQHRGIITIINSLYFGIQNSYAADILAPITRMMNEYTQIHFQIEEAFLEKLNYPELEKHRRLHQTLIARLSESGKQSILDKDPKPFMIFLKKWWLGHICIEDFKIRDFFISQ